MHGMRGRVLENMWNRTTSQNMWRAKHNTINLGDPCMQIGDPILSIRQTCTAVGQGRCCSYAASCGPHGSSADREGVAGAAAGRTVRQTQRTDTNGIDGRV